MRRALRAIVLMVLVGGCGDSGTTTTTPAPVTGPFTDIFTSIIYPGGFSAHSFSSSAAGTITVTLTNAGSPPTVVMGLGIGVPNFGPGCSLTTAVNVSAGSTPQITIPADAGAYCIAIFDVGNTIPTGENFSITTVHP